MDGVLCSYSFQTEMSHNGRRLANTWEVKKPHKSLEVPEASKIHKTPPPGDVMGTTSEKRLSNCQSGLPRFVHVSVE